MPSFSNWLFKLIASFAGKKISSATMLIRNLVNAAIESRLVRIFSRRSVADKKEEKVEDQIVTFVDNHYGCRKRISSIKYLVKKPKSFKAIRPDIQRERFTQNSLEFLAKDELEWATRGRGGIRFSEYVEIGYAPQYDRTPREIDLKLLFL